MKPNLLVVDGDAGVREALGRVLSQAGYEVVTAADSQEAAERFDPDRTRLLILDLDLPLRHAWEIFGPLANLGPGVPVLLVTNQPDHCSTSLMADVAALMEKPVDVDRLLRTIGELLAEPKEMHLHWSCGCPHDSWHKSAGGAHLQPLQHTFPFNEKNCSPH